MEKFCNGVIHTVRKGDTLYSLSRIYDVPLVAILRANPYVDIYNLGIGSRICIPCTMEKPMNKPPHMNRPPHMQTTPDMNKPPHMYNNDEMSQMTEMAVDESNQEMDMDYEPENAGESEIDYEQEPMFHQRPQDLIQPRRGMNSMPQQGMNNMPQQGMNSMPQQDMMNMPQMTEPSQYSEEMELPGPEMESDNNRIAYIVKDGDSLQDILDKCGMNLEEFMKMNSLSNVLLKQGITVIVVG